MVEIYGSTETGALATRRPTQGTEWETYSGIAMEQNQDQTRACAEHFDTPQTLNDVVELLGPNRFRLLGRNSDMINIVGKRNSLAFLNQLLLGLPGVEDGVFCMHDSGSADETPRLLAFVVAPSLTGAAIQASLRQHVDPVFLPRPLVVLATLPRDANGKLPASAMAELRATHLATRT
jgi:acyl-coenzyme A synthetase/AMP-(fatty) acid ligase